MLPFWQTCQRNDTRTGEYPPAVGSLAIVPPVPMTNTLLLRLAADMDGRDDRREVVLPVSDGVRGVVDIVYTALYCAPLIPLYPGTVGVCVTDNFCAIVM